MKVNKPLYRWRQISNKTEMKTNQLKQDENKSTIRIRLIHLLQEIFRLFFMSTKRRDLKKLLTNCLKVFYFLKSQFSILERGLVSLCGCTNCSADTLLVHFFCCIVWIRNNYRSQNNETLIVWLRDNFDHTMEPAPTGTPCWNSLHFV